MDIKIILEHEDFKHEMTVKEAGELYKKLGDLLGKKMVSIEPSKFNQYPLPNTPLPPQLPIYYSDPLRPNAPPWEEWKVTCSIL